MMRTLVAGLGNIFAGDDAFGVETIRALQGTRWPTGVEVKDFGIGGVHLAYQLLDGYDFVVIVDTVSRGGVPGTLYVIEHGPDHAEEAVDELPTSAMDAHDLAPDGVLALVPQLGGTLGRVVVVGCEPEYLTARMELSPAVASSVEAAARLVTELVENAQLDHEQVDQAHSEQEDARHTDVDARKPAPADQIRIGGG